MARRRRSERTFAEIVADQERRLPDPAVSRRPGVYGTELVDAAGRTYRLVAGEVDADRAAAIMTADGQVVVDDCGCGGYCGLDWLSTARVEELRLLGRPHPRRGNKRGRPSGWLTEYVADDGQPVLLISGNVRWSP